MDAFKAEKKAEVERVNELLDGNDDNEDETNTGLFLFHFAIRIHCTILIWSVSQANITNNLPNRLMKKVSHVCCKVLLQIGELLSLRVLCWQAVGSDCLKIKFCQSGNYESIC